MLDEELQRQLTERAQDSRIIQAIASEPWAITPAAMQRILTIAMRQDLDPQAIDSRRPTSGPAAGMRYGHVRADGIGVLNIRGPVFRYANLFTEVSGATATELAVADLRTLLDDSQVKQLVIDFDSPGGQVNGTEELAEMIFAARNSKPITAFVSGEATSAAYWMASAADRIVSNRTSIVGSIGAVLGIYTNKAQDLVEFVSTQSPKKRLDPTTDAGRAEYQRLVDSIGKVFVSTVARNRGVTDETVRSRYGEGGVMVGGDAMGAGLVDDIATLDTVFADLSTTASLNGDNTMKHETDTDPVLSEWNGDAQLRAEFNNDLESYRAYAAATEQGHVKVLRGTRRQMIQPCDPTDPAFETKVIETWKADAAIREEFAGDVVAFTEYCRHEHLVRVSGRAG